MKKLIAKIREILRNRRVRKLWTRTVSSIACLVVFVTTYALVLPAITMESQASCGIEAHQHDDSCYEERLTCTIPEADGHTHTEDCYSTKQKSICDRSEHLHTSDCYDENGNLTCGLEEHQHGKECFEEIRELVCGLEEAEGHHHDSSCYEKVLRCGKEAHTHSQACYREDAASEMETERAAVAATTTASEGGNTAAADTAASEDGNNSADAATASEDGNAAADAATASTTVDTAANADGAGESTGALEIFDPAQTASEGYVPALEELDFQQLLNGSTAIYYHRPAGGAEADSSEQIIDWQNADKDTVLGENDLLRVYLAYTIPAGSLNETNAVARYRLPANLHLTDDQIQAISQTENGLSGLYVDSDTLQITDTEKHDSYLGYEAIDGTRTPDQKIDDYYSDSNSAGNGDQAAREIISAAVRAENVYDHDGIYGEKNAYLGTDLVFTFSPYTILKNRNEYDSDGTPVKAGESVSGWFALDINMDQVDWDHNTAEIIFVSENKELNTGLVSTTLQKAEPVSEETHPAVSFEDSLTVHTGSLGSDITGNPGSDATGNSKTDTDAGTLPESSKLTVSVSAEAGTFPAGTTMVLSAVTDMDAVAEAVEGTVDSKTRGFQAVDISFRDKDGNEIEPLKPISVTMRSDSIKAATEDTSMAPVVVHVEDRKKATAEAGDSPAATVIETLPDTAENKEQSETPDATNSPDAISFEADTFSVYAIVYTVDFHYEVNGKVYDFSIPGGGFISLEHLVEVLGIASAGENTENGIDNAQNAAENGNDFVGEVPDVDVSSETSTTFEKAIQINEVEVSEAAKKFVADVKSAEFSDPELVWVGKADSETTVGEIKESRGLEVEYSAELTDKQIAKTNAQTVEAGDWGLISIKAFNTVEMLTVTMNNGDVFTIRVKDAQISTQYLSTNGRLYEVTVIYGADAKIPEDASLQVTEYNKYSEEYRFVRKTVLDDDETDSEKSEDNTVETEGTSVEPKTAAVEGETTASDSTYREHVLEALDITILDRSGETVEPEAPVEVRIVMKKLPGDKELFEKTVAVQHLDMSSGEVQVETVADTDSIGGIHIADQTAAADFTLDSFSRFAITYYQYNPRVVVNVHYVDNNGTELNGSTDNVTATIDQSISLDTYRGRMNQSGYTYLGAHYGTYSGQVITSLKGTTSSTGSLSTSMYIVEFRNGDNIVARQEYESSLRQVDVYLVYAPSSGYYIQDTIGEDGCLTIKNGTEVVQTGLDQNLFVKWYRSSNGTSGFQEVTQSKILNGTYNIPELGGPKVNVAIDEGADQYYKAEIYKVENNQEVVLAETSVYHVPYYDDVRNGGFETPYNNGTTDERVNRWPSNWQVENGQNGVVWKTTGTATDNSKRDIEIPQGAASNGTGANDLGETLRNYCFAFMPEGNQCAELNCEASGALYQDVLTIPGAQIYWSLYHRARGGYDTWKTKTDKTQNKETDTMYVVAMSTELAEKYDVTTQEKVLSILQHVNDHDHEFYDVEIIKITTTNGGNGTMEFMNSDYTMTVPPTYFGNLANGHTATAYDSGTNLNFKYSNTDWHYYTGNFSIPKDQYLTRFFFVAGNTASNNPTMGNFLDDIKLSDSVPAPNHGQATAIIQKTVQGLDTLPENYATRIEATYEVKEFNGTNSKTARNSDYDHYRTQIDERGKAVSTASWTFPITIPTGGSAAFTLGQEVSPQTAGKTDQVTGYEQTTMWRISKRNLNGENETIIASGDGKEIPDTELKKLTITEREIVHIEFINSYRKKQPVSVWKTDMDSRTIASGAVFELYKAEEFDDNNNKPKSGAVKVATGTTGTNGILFLGWLAQGEYRLLETKAPDGYILPEAGIKITVTDNKVTVMQGSNYSEAVTKGHDNWVEGQADDTNQIQVWNNLGVELPATGGPGTRLFTLFGSILILGAGALLWRRRRFI